MRIKRRGGAQTPVSCDRSLEKISQLRRRVDVSYDPSMATALQHGTWMDEEVQKDLHQGQEKKGRHPPASLRYMGSRLHAETGCRKIYAGEVFE